MAVNTNDTPVTTHTRRVAVLAFILLACLATTGCGLRFRAVEPEVLYVSGQPEPEQLEALYRQHGFRTLVNLRGPHPDTEWYPFEKQFARRHGLTWIDMDISRKRGPTPEQVRTLEQLYDQPRYHPVFVHCWGGTDRSGVAAAIYRIRHQGWSADRVLSEMADHGFSSFFWPDIAEFVRRYDRRQNHTDRTTPPTPADRSTR